MTQHNPWKGDGTPPPDEAETAEEAFMRRMADIAKLASVKDQLEALNGGHPIMPLSANELATIHAIANTYAIACAQQGGRPQPDVLRSAMGAGFQILRPFATAEQEALGTMRHDTLPN